MTIVGIVAHAKSSSLEADVKEGFYFLPLRSPQPRGAKSPFARTARHPEMSLAPCRRPSAAWTPTSLSMT